MIHDNVSHGSICAKVKCNASYVQINSMTHVLHDKFLAIQQAQRSYRSVSRNISYVQLLIFATPAQFMRPQATSFVYKPCPIVEEVKICIIRVLIQGMQYLYNYRFSLYFFFLMHFMIRDLHPNKIHIMKIAIHNTCPVSITLVLIVWHREPPYKNKM